MLAGLRSAAKSKLAIPVIIVLAVSFAIWGVNDAFTGGARDAVATVGPERVTVDDFSRAYQNQVQAIGRQTGQVMTSQQARAAGLDRQLLEELTTRAALDAKAGELGLGASDAMLARDIRETSAFQDTVRGEFSRVVYETALAQAGFSRSEYERGIGRDLRRDQMVRAIVNPARPPSGLTDARQSYRNETRQAEVLILPAALVSLDAAPDEAALRAVLEDNRQIFTFPEMRAITVAWFDMESMQAIVEVDEDDVQALFEFRRTGLAQPATRSFVQLLAPDRETAEAAAARLEAGESPAEIAADLDLASPIDEAEAARGDIVDSRLAAELFDTGPEPRILAVDGTFGWSAVQVRGGQAASEIRMEDVAESLRAELAAESAADRLFDALADFNNARGAGMSLEDAAAEAGVSAHSYAPVSAGAQDSSGDIYVDLAAAPAVLAQAFTLGVGQISDLIELPDGGYAVVRLDRVTAQRVAELDEVRSEAEQLWRATQLDEALQAIESRAREQIAAGASFAEAAAEIGQPARTEVAVIRRGQSSGPVDARLAAELFSSDIGALVSGRTAGDSRALARVTEVSYGEGRDPALAAELAQELTNDLLMQFQIALSEEYPVRIYPDQISRVLGDEE